MATKIMRKNERSFREGENAIRGIKYIACNSQRFPFMNTAFRFGRTHTPVQMKPSKFLLL